MGTKIQYAGKSNRPDLDMGSYYELILQNSFRITKAINYVHTKVMCGKVYIKWPTNATLQLEKFRCIFVGTLLESPPGIEN